MLIDDNERPIQTPQLFNPANDKEIDQVLKKIIKNPVENSNERDSKLKLYADITLKYKPAMKKESRLVISGMQPSKHQ